MLNLPTHIMPLTAVTSHWAGWLMLGLLVCIGTVNILQPGFYARALTSLPTTKERDSIFAGSGSDMRSRFILIAYLLIVVSVLLTWSGTGNDDFSFSRMLMMTSLAGSMIIARTLMQVVVATVFFERRSLETFMRHYLYLNDSLALLLYPVVLAAIFTPVSRTVIYVILALLVVLYFAVLVYKIIALMPMSISSLLWLPLYLVTVEALPMAGMFVGCNIMAYNHFPTL